jgi:fatty acid desaturase
MARSNRAGLVQLGGHLALLAATGTAVALAWVEPWLLVPAMVTHGIVLVFLFAPLHETIHRTAFRSRWLNDLVAWPCGAVLVLPPTYFRAFHFAHHRHTQDPLRDPELAAPKPTTLGAYLWQVSGLPYWRERVGTTVRHAMGEVGEAFVGPAVRPRVIREARRLLGLYGLLGAGSVILGSDVLLWFWLGPVLLGQPFLRLYLMAEHTGCPLVPAMLENSRTTRSTALVRRLAWNMPYHAEHHAHPSLPFHALPAAHRRLEAAIRVRARGYVAVHRALLRGCDRGPRAATEPARGAEPALSRDRGGPGPCVADPSAAGP